MKIVYLALGLIAFIIGLVGIILPIIPTTPFMLLTSFCLIKSSEKLNGKFIKTKFYEKHVKTFKEKKGMTLKTKLMILIPVALVLGIIYTLINSNIMRFILITLFVIKLIVFIKIKTLKNDGINF